MNKVTHPRYKETVYSEVLPNGLHVDLWHKPSFSTTKAIFGTPYGALDAHQINEKKETFCPPYGVAHFLEHKLFENEDLEVSSQFAALGAMVNAYTSYNETAYYFTLSSPLIEEPLNLLLDFVQELKISEASVEKEKGIITQELLMYLQMPDMRVSNEMLHGMYRYHPYNQDIGGSPEDVAKITLQDLEQAYAYNYHPSRMHLALVTPEDPEKVMSLIRANQAKKTFGPAQRWTRYYPEEPKEVAEKRVVAHLPVSQKKVALGIKLPAIPDVKERIKKDYILQYALESVFGPSNPDYQIWLDQKRITPSFLAEEDLGKDASLLIFSDDQEDPEAFVAFVEEGLTKLKNEALTEEKLELSKRNSIGQSLRVMNNPEMLASYLFRGSLDQMTLFEEIEELKALTLEEAMHYLRGLDTTAQTVSIVEE